MQAAIPPAERIGAGRDHDYPDSSRNGTDAAFIVIMVGFLFQWPTLVTLVMIPILVTVYVRLAHREEREVRQAFGRVWDDYRPRPRASFRAGDAADPSPRRRLRTGSRATWRGGRGRLAEDRYREGGARRCLSMRGISTTEGTGRSRAGRGIRSAG